MGKHSNIALVGNPNTGKSSLFNQLTGLRQKTGNFPGVTVDKKTGIIQLPNQETVQIIDLPGTYSLYPNSQDERIVLNILSNPKDENFPDAVVYVADVTQLERHLLLLTQIRDLGIPTCIALNMIDLADKQGIIYQVEPLEKAFQLPVIPINARTGEGIEKLKETMGEIAQQHKVLKPIYIASSAEQKTIEQLRLLFEVPNNYQAILWAHHYKQLPFLSQFEKNSIENIVKNANFEDIRLQISETMTRFQTIVPVAQQSVKKVKTLATDTITDKIDRILTHAFMGPAIFLLLMLLTFQAIFSWAEFPMTLIEGIFTNSSEFLKAKLPDTLFTSLLTDGILAGLGGVLVFIPQIAILFFIISILEEVGYMSRAVFLFDKLMQQFGLNGRSIVALISGGACAIPAIMSTRTISNWKERLITIMVTPFISCSARIPVYTLLIGFVISTEKVWWIFSFQSLALMGLYLLGVVMALLAAWVLSKVIKSDERTYLMIELPDYQMPHWKNVFLNVWSKVHSFLTEAGKTIIIVTIVLWVLAAFGPGDGMQIAKQRAEATAKTQQLSQTATNDLLQSEKLEASYAGHLGKFIEPAIRPLGFDWKIGIALITSFAAREVFVGTMATIYSIGSTGEENQIRERMQRATFKDGRPVFTLATSLSLLIFYAFALQCISTVAIVKRETNSWRWTLLQLIGMSLIAYLGSLLVYQLLA